MAALDDLLRLLALPSEPLALYAALHLSGRREPAVTKAAWARLAGAGGELAAALLELLERAAGPGGEAALLRRVMAEGSAEAQVAALLRWKDAAAGEIDALVAPRLAAGESDFHIFATMLAALREAPGPLPENLREAVGEALLSRDPRVRANAAELAARRAPDHFRPGLTALLGDGVPRVRAAVARAVWEFAPLEVESRVRRDLDAEDPRALLAALHVLHRLDGFPDAGSLLLRFTTHESAQVRLMAWKSLEGREGELDGAAMAARYLVEDSAACRRALSARAAAGPRDAFLDALFLELQTSGEAARRSRAALGVGEAGAEEHGARLAPFVTEPDDRVRADVYESLGRLGGPGLPQLLEHALADPAPRVAANAAIGLWRAGGETAMGRLLEWLRGVDPGRAASAAFALGEIGSDRVVAPLLEVAEQLRDQGAESLADRALLKQIMKAIGKVRGT